MWYLWIIQVYHSAKEIKTTAQCKKILYLGELITNIILFSASSLNHNGFEIKFQLWLECEMLPFLLICKIMAFAMLEF